MFGLSFTHLLVLGVIVLIFIGPEQLPEVLRTVARLLNEWKRATSDIQSSLTNSIKTDFPAQPQPPSPPPPPEPAHPTVEPLVAPEIKDDGEKKS